MTKRTAAATEAAWLAKRDAKTAAAKVTPVPEVKQVLNVRVPVKNSLLNGPK